MADNGQKQFNEFVDKQYKKVVNLIDNVLKDVTFEIESRKNSLVGEEEIPSLRQLESISNELIKMKTVFSPKHYYPTYTRQIVDSWDIQSRLGDKLLGVAQEYKKLK